MLELEKLFFGNIALVKLCTKCGESKAASYFSKRVAAKDGLQNSCKSCKSAWQSKNLNLAAEACARWRNADPEKTRARAAFMQSREFLL